MKLIDELEQIDSSLKMLKRDFNQQLNALDNDLGEFHKLLIDLSAKYPDQKELLEFIVFINDRIETNQTNMKEILNESINTAIIIERKFVANQIKNRKDLKKKPLMQKIDLKDIKWIILGLAALIFLGIVIFSPDVLITIFDKLVLLAKG